jgi:hypothetical protein
LISKKVIFKNVNFRRKMLLAFFPLQAAGILKLIFSKFSGNDLAFITGTNEENKSYGNKIPNNTITSTIGKYILRKVMQY